MTDDTYDGHMWLGEDPGDPWFKDDTGSIRITLDPSLRDPSHLLLAMSLGGTAFRTELSEDSAYALASSIMAWYDSHYYLKVATDEEVATDLTEEAI